MDHRDSALTRRLLQVDAPSVQSHLTMLQGVVNRLAANSASCKTWCVDPGLGPGGRGRRAGQGQVAARRSCPYLVVRRPRLLLPRTRAAVPHCDESFAKKLHEGTARIDDVFIVASRLQTCALFVEHLWAFTSF